MTDSTTTTTATDGGGGDGGGQESNTDRIDAIDSRLDRIETALARLVPGSHAQAQSRTESRLDRASDVEERVRAELARARQEQERQQAADRDRQERETMGQRLAKLEEQPPAEPIRRATRALGWGTP